MIAVTCNLQLVTCNPRPLTKAVAEIPAYDIVTNLNLKKILGIGLPGLDL